MITSINKIIGIGKYDRYETPVEIHKNQIIFGFNGAGKSTLSDVFYSLSDAEHCKLLMDRKTLVKDDGSSVENPFIEFETENGKLEYSDEKWNGLQNIYVFNDQYIDDYTTLVANYDIKKEQLLLGKDVTRLYNQKKSCIDEFNERLENINSAITNNKSICEKIGFGKNKINARSWSKRVTTIAKTSLYSEGQKEWIKKELDNKKIHNENYVLINNWMGLIVQHYRYQEIQLIPVIKGVEKTLVEIPSVTNTELAEHLKHCMKNMDVNWFASGMNNLADNTRCPFCGGKLDDDFVKHMSDELDRYIKSRQKKKSDRIISLLRSILPYFDENQLEKLFEDINIIKTENENKKVLLKKTSSIIDKMLLVSDLEPGCFHDICDAVREKINNPNKEITLSNESRGKINSLIKTMINITRLIDAFKYELERIAKKIKKEEEYEKTSALFEASFGENAEIFKSMVADAKSMITLDSSIRNFQRKIDELAENKKIEGINNILEELNVNYRVQAEKNKFYVKIAGYKRAEYEKDNKKLCSEGERRMLAFAYFMQEVYSDVNPKTIVIDDPISSLDLNRKSIVAHLICELMEKDSDQIIVLSHDISFIEKIDNLVSPKAEIPSYLEIKKSFENTFTILNIKDYLSTDKEVYEEIICDGYNTDKYEDRIVALMALRPYSYVVIKPDNENTVFKSIVESSTYFAHSIYSYNKRVSYKEENYNTEGLRRYCNIVKTATDFNTMNIDNLIPEGFIYKGLNYNEAWKLYSSISLNCIKDLRKKALVFRILLETTLFMLKEKAKFDPEHIGDEYKRAVRTTDKEKKKLFIEIRKMYDISKKYHHGAESGSLMGLSALNPDEMVYFDKSITLIHDWIKANPTKLNPNESLAVI